MCDVAVIAAKRQSQQTNSISGDQQDADVLFVDVYIKIAGHRGLMFFSGDTLEKDFLP
jgi:hypothetical protein